MIVVMGRGRWEGDRTSARFWLLVGLVLTGLTPLVVPSAVPVYDGLPVPADRYRYVDPPPGYPNPGPPLSAHVGIRLVGGGNPPIDLPTAEVPPQAELQLFHGDVDGNVPAVPVVADAEVTITPVPPPSSPLPRGLQLHGNVYLMKVIAAGHDLRLHASPQSVVSLRQPRTSSAEPRVVVLVGGQWQLLATRASSQPGVLTAHLPELGYVALVEHTGDFATSRSHTGLITTAALAGVAVLGLLVLRTLRTRRR